MSHKEKSFENVLQDLTGYLIELLCAESVICYFESSPDIFTVAGYSGLEKKPGIGDTILQRADIEGVFADNFQPLLLSNRLSVYAQSGGDSKSKTYSVSSALILPVVHHNRMVGIFEALNPVQYDWFMDNKSLKALHALIQNVFEAQWMLSRIKETPLTEPGIEYEDLSRPFGKTNIIGASKAITDLKTLISRIAPTDTTVLLKGETGTGKNIVAQSIHEQSTRKEMPFVNVSCAAIPENLLESELFGHEKGAFTGAFRRRIGRFERAHPGTIFLDEIGEISQNLQVKLLNVLQYQEFERLGGTQTIKVNTRIIAATNKDLDEAIAKGEFREDLYYRINVLPITIPPLRERIDDIEPLTRYFIKRINLKLNRRYEKISDEALFLLKKYHWPGNVRELENILERAMVIGNGPVIMPHDLPQDIFGILDSIRKPKKEFAMREGDKSLWDVEKGIIDRALKEMNWNQSKTARALGITRNHLRYRIKKYGITKPKE